MISFKDKKIKFLWVGFWSLALFIALFIFSISINLFGLFGKIPSLEILENPKSDLSSEVYTEDHVLMGKYFKFNRSNADYKDLPVDLVNALIATEDVRFYKHSGVDFKGTFAIFLYAVTFQKRGSSTLSQQLAKNLFQMRQSKEYQGPLSKFMPVVKFKEIITATRLERAYTKQEILNMYLNTVEFGNGTYGITSAAKKYFNKKTSKLKTEEAAMLIGLLKGPSVYDPIRKEEKALNRRNTVLSQMVKYNYLSKDQFEKLKQTPLALDITYENQNTGLAPYFRDYVEDYLVNWCDEHGYNLYADGLKIYTTINSKMQTYAEDAVSNHMTALQKEFFAEWKGKTPWASNKLDDKKFVERFAKRSERYRVLKAELGNNPELIFKEMNKKVKMKIYTLKGTRDTTMSPMDSVRYYLHFLHTGMVSMDPHNGQVKAWVGDVNFRYFKYDHVKKGARQPGSTFKPLLYAYAIEEKGLTPCSKVLDTQVPFTMPDGKVWIPKNSNNNYSNDYMTLRLGMARSVNTIAAYLMKLSGPDSIVAFAKRLGISSQLEAVPTLALGTSDVSVFDMTQAYCAFVNNGYRYEPLMITRIEDKYGNVLEEFRNIPQQVISSETAASMVYMLKGSAEEDGGTARDLVRKFNITSEVGGKTGTTQNSADGWFMGVSPDLVSGVWVGADDKNIHFPDMRFGQGARMALPIWGLYMQKVFADKNLGVKTKFEIPESLNASFDCESATDEVDSTIVDLPSSFD
ncbi:penicillin-binding protein 1A [Sporocytophaga myxococcoides]|uniref:penicillin-binding protein 1A n=1 Tax=Sporocytophaga myxococcoides TaxID=153721 RepID=UPI00040FCD89|nr:transglycosylase domain-containing protein [Sporocytophaga myxococcoides]